MLRTLFAVTAAAACLMTASAHADDHTTESDYLALRAGVFDFDDNFEAAHIGLEYRGMPFWYDLRPIAGLEANEDGAAFVFGGLAYDVALGHVIITPSFAVSAYSDDSDSRDLGGPLEFRSGLEAAWEFENRHRVGVAIHHLSNAGIYDSNPGTETLTATYAIPFR